MTEESFCDFFLSQKTLVHLLEVISRVEDTIQLYVHDIQVWLFPSLSLLEYVMIFMALFD